MSSVATSRPSIASIMHDSMRPSVDTVGDDASYLDSQFWCFVPSAHHLLLIFTSSFLSFSNIRYSILFIRCSYMRSWGFFSSTNLRSWNCCNYFRNADSLFLPKTFIPCLILNFIRMVSFVVMLVGGVVSKKLVIAFIKLTWAFAELWRAWDPKIRLFHTMERRLALLPL